MKHLALVATLATATTAQAQTDHDIMMLADSLGTMIAAEDPCGLAYDQTAIGNFIDENIPGESMDFASQLQATISIESYSMDDMSASAKTAHCRAVENSARHHGFIE